MLTPLKLTTVFKGFFGKIIIVDNEKGPWQVLFLRLSSAESVRDYE